MSHIAMGSWEILVDIIGLCICSTTILYLVMTRVKNIRVKNHDNHLAGEDRETFIRFDDEMLGQLIKQQSEKAFERISHILKKEQISLLELIEERRTAKLEKPAKKMPDPCPVSNRYDDVGMMTGQGLSVEEISEKTKIPRGEIALIVKLRNRGKANILDLCERSPSILF